MTCWEPVYVVGADALKLARQSISDEKLLAQMEAVLTGKAQELPSGRAAAAASPDATKCIYSSAYLSHALVIQPQP